MSVDNYNESLLFELNNKKYFCLYACCIPVKGKLRGVIYDLQRGEIHLVPNILIDILTGSEIKTIFNSYKENSEALLKYFDYLYTNDLIFFTNTDVSVFAPLSEELIEIPGKIDLLSIEIDSASLSKKNLFKNIDLLGVSELMLIQSEKENVLKNIHQILDSLKNSIVNNIVIVVPDNIYSVKVLNSIKNDYLRVRRILIYNSDKSCEIDSIIYTTKDLKEMLCKRITSTDDFVINTKSYIEAKNRNLYFNRRVYIDDMGNIKHSYDDEKVYGNIKEDAIPAIIHSSEFQELSMVTKDKIEICRGCEFRYICQDNRIPEKISNSKYRHTTLCNYNPKTASWNYEKN